MARLGLALVAVLAIISVANAKIHQSNVQRDDRKLIPLTEAFGFAAGGKIDITIRDIGVYHLHGSTEKVRNNINMHAAGASAAGTVAVSPAPRPVKQSRTGCSHTRESISFIWASRPAS